MEAAEASFPCPRCTTLVVPGARFCHSCGQFLGEVAPRRVEERKSLTVLFADIRGSTRLIFNEDPERARDLFEPAIRAMTDAVRRFGGTVNRVLGDGVMAMFGAPIAMEQHALGACCAALHMRDALLRLGRDYRQRDGVDLAARIGVHSGEVVVHAIGNDLSGGLDAAGAVVHIAARIEQAAEPGEAWISAATLRLAESYVTADAPRMLDVRGAPEPVEVHRLVAVDPRRSRLQIGSAKGYAPFVSRAAELSALASAYRRSAGGEGTGVVLVGDAGCGKSRVVHEFLAELENGHHRVLRAQCQPYDAGTALAPLAGLVRSHFGIAPEDGTAEAQDRILQGLRHAGTAMEASAPALLAAIGRGTEAPGWRGLGPDQRQRRLHEAFVGLFRHLAEEEPLILTVEDLHWADGETLAVLDRVAEGLPHTRQMLLLDHRPEFTHRWPGPVSALRVEPLAPEDTLDLVRQLLGKEIAAHRLGRLLAERTGGNPFFLEECVAALVEQGALLGRSGAYSLVAEIDALDLPDTVRSVIASRIDRLPPGDKQVLQGAAIMAREVSPRILAATMDRGAEEVRDALGRLRRAELLVERRHGAELVFDFRHALTQETAYSGMLKSHRRAQHARLVDVLEDVYADRLPDAVEALALHAGRGEVWTKAARYGRAAGAKAAGRSANREAVQFFEQAMEALSRLPESEEVLREAVDLRFDLRTPLFRLGRIGPLFGRLREAEVLAQRLGDNERLGQLAIFMSHQSWLAGDNAGAIGAAERAATIGRSMGDEALILRAGFQAALGQLGLCRFAEAAETMARVAELGEQPGYLDRYGLERPLSVVALGYRARALSELGDAQRAAAAVAECKALAETVRRPFTSIFATIAEGHMLLMTGDPTAAMTPLEEAVEYARKAETQLMMPVAQGFFGAACTAAGRWTDGIRHLSAAVRDADAMGFMFQQPLRLALLAEAHLAAGQETEAALQAEAARSLAERQGARGALAQALTIEARLAARRGGDGAQALLARALQIAGQLGLRPLAAHIRAVQAAPAN